MEKTKEVAFNYKFDKGPSGKAHIHLLNERPLVGTSGVSKVVSKVPPWWASGLAVKVLGCADPKLLTKIKNKSAAKAEVEFLKQSLTKKLVEIKAMNVDQFLDLVDSAYRAHQSSLAESADAGTDLHAELERFVKDKMEGITEPMKPYHARIEPFIKWYDENVATPLWSEAHCFSSVYWLGGISDFGFIDKKGLLCIMDFKSSKAAYTEQFWQCGGYDLQFSENGGFTEHGVKLFDLPKPVDYYAILPFGMEKPLPQLNYDVEKCRDMFKHCLELYKELPRD